jgi:subtilisin family serine protease
MTINFEVDAIHENRYEYLSKIDRNIIKVIQNCSQNEIIDVIILAEPGCLNSVKQLVFSCNGTVRTLLNDINALAVTLPKTSIEDISKNTSVKKIWLDYNFTMKQESNMRTATVEFFKDLIKNIKSDERQTVVEKFNLELSVLSENETQLISLSRNTLFVNVKFEDVIPQTFFTYCVGAEKLWAAGYTGEGTYVAVLDNGITASHPMLKSAIIGGHSEVPFEPEWDSLQADHGTTVASMAIGRPIIALIPEEENLAMAFAKWFPDKVILPGDYSWGTVPFGYIGIAFIGEAPSAKLWVEKVMSYAGYGESSWVLAGMQHILNLRSSGQVHVDVVSMSIGVSMPWSAINDGTDPWSLMVNTLVANGITVVTSSGNNGPGAFTISQPAVASKNIGVGGYVYARMFKMYLDWDCFGSSDLVYMDDEAEMIWWFASRGPTRDYRTGVCVVAPCAFTIGALGDRYLAWVWGTSFSAPRVAGEAALLIQYYKEKVLDFPTPEIIRAAIIAGADYIPNYLPIEQGGGRWNPCKAAEVIFDKKLISKARNILDSNDYHNQRTRNQLLFTNGVSENVVKSLDIEHYARFYFNLKDPDMYRVHITDIFETCPGMNKLWVYVFDPKGDLANIGIAQRVGDKIMTWGESYYYSNFIGEFEASGLYRWNHHYAPMDPGIWEVIVRSDSFNCESVGFKWRIEKSEVSMSITKHNVFLDNNGIQLSLEGYGAGLKAYEGYKRIIKGQVKQDQTYETTFEVHYSATELIVSLEWDDDYLKKFPVDLDLYLIDPSGQCFSNFALPGICGATVNIPEIDYFDSNCEIVPGIWTLIVVGYKITPSWKLEDFVITIEERVRDVSKPIVKYNVIEAQYFEELPTENIIVVGGETYGTYQLSFKFPFYDGKSYEIICVNPNGYITFDQGFEQSYELESLFMFTPMIAVMAAAELQTTVYAIPHQDCVTITWYGRRALRCEPLRDLMLVQLYRNGDIVMSYSDWLPEAIAGISKGDGANWITISPSSMTAFQFAYSHTTTTTEVWGYTASNESYEWTPEGTEYFFGDEVYMEYVLPFSFPFYGETYNRIYVGTDGYLTFDQGRIACSDSDIRNIFATEPTIAVMGKNLEEVTVYIENHDDYITIVWHGCPAGYMSAIEEHDLMLVKLYATGEIVMSYYDWLGGIAGVSKGDGTTNTKILPLDATQFNFTYSNIVVKLNNVQYAINDLLYFFESGTLPLVVGWHDFALYTLPFNFRFYGDIINEVFVLTDGYMQFDAAHMPHYEGIPEHALWPTIAVEAQSLYTAIYAFDHGTYVNFLWVGRRGSYELEGGANRLQKVDTTSSLDSLFPACPLMLAQLNFDGKIVFSYINWIEQDSMDYAVAGISAGRNLEYIGIWPKSGSAFQFTPEIMTPAAVTFSNAQPLLPASSLTQITYVKNISGNYIFVSKTLWHKKFFKDGGTSSLAIPSLYENARAFR